MLYSKVVEQSTGFQMAPFFCASSHMIFNSALYVDFQGSFFSIFSYIFTTFSVLEYNM